MNKDIAVYKNAIDDSKSEFGAYYIDENAIYYIVGLMDETDFETIIKNISYSDFKGYRY